MLIPPRGRPLSSDAYEDAYSSGEYAIDGSLPSASVDDQ